MDGLATGLIGGPNDTVEGLAINVSDTTGHRASWWSSSSAGMGMGIADPELGGGFSTIRGHYGDLTGGPPTSQSASSEGGTSAAG